MIGLLVIGSAADAAAGATLDAATQAAGLPSTQATPPPLAAPTAAVEPTRNTPRRGKPLLTATPTPRPMASEPEAPEDLLRVYEIQLTAHRRELLQREAALDRAQRRIAELTRAASPRRADSGPAAERVRQLERFREQARADIDRLTARTKELEAEVGRPSLMTPPGSAPGRPDAASGSRDALVASLRQELDVERENRATLETEIQRLVAESRSEDRLEPISRSLENARAEILVLNHRLADEQRAREALEVTIERLRAAANVPAAPDWLERFDATMKERRQQSERLQEELHKANEAIVALRARLEANPPSPSQGSGQDLAVENTKLREALEAAQRANTDLHTQAELAARLAELLYRQPR